MRKLRPLLLLAVFLLAACASDLKLKSLDYPIAKSAPQDGILVMIDKATASGLYPVRANLSVGLRTYYAQPGLMLRQVSDHELGAMFGSYEVKDSFAQPASGRQRLTLALEVPSFKFASGIVSVAVDAKVFGPDRKELLHKVYEGRGGDREMDVAGIGLEAAIEQNSALAYRQAFEGLRADLAGLLQQDRGLAKN